MTTERCLGVEQDLTDAPCDHLGLRLEGDQESLLIPLPDILVSRQAQLDPRLKLRLLQEKTSTCKIRFGSRWLSTALSIPLMT
jgi:hypothetical protein